MTLFSFSTLRLNLMFHNYTKKTSDSELGQILIYKQKDFEPVVFEEDFKYNHFSNVAIQIINMTIINFYQKINSSII